MTGFFVQNRSKTRDYDPKKGRLFRGEMGQYAEDSMVAAVQKKDDGRTISRVAGNQCPDRIPVYRRLVRQRGSGHCGAGSRRGFRLTENFQDAPLFFRPEELKAIIHAAKFARGAGYPYTEDLAKALEKIESRLDPEQIRYLRRHASFLDVFSAVQSPAMTSILQQLEQAVVESRTLSIEYRKEKAAVPGKRLIDPYGLVFRNQVWYVVACCHMRRDVRTFRVDRIVRLVPTDDFFQKPEGFTVTEYFREQSDREREADGPMVRIRIRGDEETLNAMCRHWHLQHYVTERTDEEARFLLDAPTMNKYLPIYLMTLGTGIQVLEPASLRRRVAEMAGRLARHYENEPD